MLGLYIHIPFCKQKCFYCDFFSVNYNNSLADKYISSIINHSKKYKNTKIDTIYIGGGTPSVLSVKQIKTLLENISKIFNINKIKEFTFELNPESATKEKLQLLKNLGVNRLSIGLQSVDDKDLKQLGRIHNFKTFSNAFNMAKKAGFENINLDLIYGLPNQTLKEWEKVLKKALKFNSAHISLYPLAIEQDTKFYLNGTSTDDEVQRLMYDKSVKMLEKSNYIHYEISNWAKKGKESIHNSNYWRNFEYIGLGAGACGYYNKTRYKNIANIQKYIENPNILQEKELVSSKTKETEAIILGLRLLKEGIDMSKFENKKNIENLKKLLNENILIKNKNIIKIHKNYVYTSNSIFSFFI